jgi:DNA polymerase IV
MQRVVLHLDMDAFYASIEQRDHPELRGKPVIVGGAARRGVVMTASYEARPFGVHSAMPMARARQLCPQALVVPPRMAVYAEVSRQLMEVLGSYSPLVEPLSLDEAFVDMTGAEGLFGAPEAMARALQASVRERTGLGASVGAAKNKFLAKLASDLDKPNGITVVPFGAEVAFIAPLPIRRLWGVGPKAAELLGGLGLGTIGDVARCSEAALAAKVGSGLAAHIHALAHAEDPREVVPDRDARSVGSETTLDEDLRGEAAVWPVLRQMCDRVARALRKEELCAGGLRVKLRYSRGFRLMTRQCLLEVPSDDSAGLGNAARELLERFDLEEPIRLVGAAGFRLQTSAATRQLDLFGEKPREKRSELEHAVDAIRERFGDKIGFGS